MQDDTHAILMLQRFQQPTCLLQILLRWNLELHERSLLPIVNAFRYIDERKQGKMSGEQFSNFCNIINPAVSEDAINTLMANMSHFESGVITFSSCAHTLMAELTQMMHHVTFTPANTLVRGQSNF